MTLCWARPTLLASKLVRKKSATYNAFVFRAVSWTQGIVGISVVILPTPPAVPQVPIAVRRIPLRLSHTQNRLPMTPAPNRSFYTLGDHQWCVPLVRARVIRGHICSSTTKHSKPEFGVLLESTSQVGKAHAYVAKDFWTPTDPADPATDSSGSTCIVCSPISSRCCQVIQSICT